MGACILDKCLWVVSGGIEAVPGIQKAKEMGLFVVVSDGSPKAPGFQFADHKVIASTYDIQCTLKKALNFHRKVRPINGVICFAADVPLTVAVITNTLNLPGISIETAKRATDKLEMKRYFKKLGIPIPWFSPIESANHLKKIISSKNKVFIIKPVDSRGARGVLRLTSKVDLDWAYSYSKSFSPTSRVMIEEFLEGPQVSTESILLNGRGFTPGFCDRNYEFLERFTPFIIENGGEQPSKLDKHQVIELKNLAEKAALTMGIYTGIAKGDLIYTQDGPVVIEMAARLSGGWFSSDQIPIATGVDLLKIAIKLALGESILPDEATPKFSKGVAIRYFFPEPGKVIDIQYPDSLHSLPWVHKLLFFVERGDTIEKVTDHTKRAGCVITTGATRKEAVERAEWVVSQIKIVTCK